ncbi:MAG: hypothetical protein FWH01_10035 [Oscillospiraceae bacterium]|nr:hypothetical protein [Oscillospiraceae bacterium]
MDVGVERRGVRAGGTPAHPGEGACVPGLRGVHAGGTPAHPGRAPAYPDYGEYVRAGRPRTQGGEA